MFSQPSALIARSLAQRRVVVLTAIPVEFKAVRAYVQDPVEVMHPQGTVYEVGTFSRGEAPWLVAIVEIGAGNDTASLEAERAISHFQATHALFVGVAGGLKDVVLGDVVAATKVYGYESGKSEKEFQPRPDVGESAYDLVQRAKAVARAAAWWTDRVGSGTNSTGNEPEPPRALVGAIASGGKVVASRKSETAALLRQTYSDALAVEMEGRGFLRAGHAAPSVRTLVVRGISDLLDKKTESDHAGWQQIAASNAAAFAFAVLAGLRSATETDQQRGLVDGRDHDEGRAGPPVASALALGGRLSQATSVVQVLSQLYPLGPLERHVWLRAGGDVSTLDLTGAGQSAWFSAIRQVQHGGRLTLEAILDVAESDFPMNPDVRTLRGITR